QHAGESYTPCLAEGTLSWPEHSPARPKRVRIQKFPAETTETCRQAFCLAEAWTQRMPPFLSSEDVYSAREIALAAGVSEAQVAALMGAGSGYVGRDEAVRIGRVALFQVRGA